MFLFCLCVMTCIGLFTLICRCQLITDNRAGTLKLSKVKDISLQWPYIREPIKWVFVGRGVSINILISLQRVPFVTGGIWAWDLYYYPNMTASAIKVNLFRAISRMLQKFFNFLHFFDWLLTDWCLHGQGYEFGSVGNLKPSTVAIMLLYLQCN